MNDPRARAKVARWGLKVECLICDWRGRHRPEKQGRLALRRCAICENRSLRMSRWVKRNPGEVEKARRWLIQQGELARQLPLVENLGESLRSPLAPVDEEIVRRGLGHVFGLGPVPSSSMGAPRRRKGK